MTRQNTSTRETSLRTNIDVNSPSLDMNPSCANILVLLYLWNCSRIPVLLEIETDGLELEYLEVRVCFHSKEEPNAANYLIMDRLSK